MASDPRFDTSANPYDQASQQYGEPPRGRSKWSSCLIGCLGVLAIMIVLGVIARHLGGTELAWFVCDCRLAGDQSRDRFLGSAAARESGNQSASGARR